MRIFSFAIMLLLAGCAAAPGRGPAASNPACAATVFPENPHFGPATLDKFGGRYESDNRALFAGRQGAHRLTVQRPGYATREIVPDSSDSWNFHDGCGVEYRFTLPPDGPGAWLKIHDTDGTVSEWHRS